MRIVKTHDERREEIVDAADMLFRSKGYDTCTINDILRSVSIAKGTFYHYFNAKEDVLDAVVDRYASIALGQVHQALKTTGLRPAEKLLLAFQSMRVQHTFDEHLLDDLHESGNALLHQKSLYRMVSGMAPILAGIVEEGTQSGAWRCRYPLAYMRIYLAAALSLMDEGIFQADAEFQKAMMPALISVLEKMLEVPDDTFLSMVAVPE